MDTLHELIQRYHLEDDGEFVIIPLQKTDGRVKRCHLLKRRFMRIVFPSGNHADYPLEAVIEATMRYPEMPLSEALPLFMNALGPHISVGHEPSGTDNTGTEPDNRGISGGDEKPSD